MFNFVNKSKKSVVKSVIFVVLAVLVFSLAGCGADFNKAMTTVTNDTDSAITDVVVKSGADKVQIGEVAAKSSVEKEITYYPGKGITIEYITDKGDKLASFIDIAYEDGFDNAESVCLRYHIGKSGMPIFKADITQGTNWWLAGVCVFLGAALVAALIIAVIRFLKKPADAQEK